MLDRLRDRHPALRAFSRRTCAAMAAVALCLGIAWGGPALAADEIGRARPLEFEEEDGFAICLAARSLLDGAPQPFANLTDRLRNDREPRAAFISVSNGTERAHVAFGQGPGLTAALRDAAQRVPDARRDGPDWLKVDVVTECEHVDDLRPTRLLNRYPDLYGLAFDWDARLAWLPEELFFYGMAPPKGPLWLEDFVDRAREGRGDPERMAAIVGEDAPSATRFRCASWFLERRRAVPLYRGHRLWTDISRQDLGWAATAAGDYLARCVKEDGRFDYVYLPAIDRSARSYNIVRHAGTVMSMLDLYSETGDEDVLAASRRALDWLADQAEPFGEPAGEMSCFVELGHAGLGDPALAVISMALHEEVTGDRRYRPLMLRLGRFVEFCIREDGSFISKLNAETGRPTDFVSQYYPGEALLALLRLNKVAPDRTWVDAAERGLTWLITVRDRDVTPDTIIHDHWLLYALDEYYRVEPDPMVVTHAKKIASSIMWLQRRESRFPDWIGSFYNPPRSTPVSTRNEGLLAAIRLFRAAGEEDMADELIRTLHLAMAFQLQMQLRPESALYMGRPEYALGAVRGGFEQVVVRIDYCQPLLSKIILPSSSFRRNTL